MVVNAEVQSGQGTSGGQWRSQRPTHWLQSPVLCAQHFSEQLHPIRWFSQGTLGSPNTTSSAAG